MDKHFHNNTPLYLPSRGECSYNDIAPMSQLSSSTPPLKGIWGILMAKNEVSMN